MATFNYINDYCYIGKEEIIGKDIDSAGRHSNPVAKIADYGDRIYNPAPNIGALFVKVESYYHEATNREDFPYFQLFIYDKNNKLISESKSWYPDIYYYPDEHSSFLQCKIDLKKLQGARKTVKYRCVLKCFLEVSKYRGCPESQREVTTSDRKEMWLTINITPAREPGKKPEVSCSITASCSGKGWPSTNCVRSDWGDAYKFIISVHNYSNVDIEGETFTLFENGKAILKDSLSEDVTSGKVKTVVKGEGDWTLQPNKNRGWQWWEQKNITGALKTNTLSKTFKYSLKYTLEDQEWDFYGDVPNSDKLSVLVKVPDWKVNALETYNWIIGWELAGDILSILAAAGIFATGAGALVSGLSVIVGGGGILSITTLAKQRKAEFMQYIKDPPDIDLNYKKPVVVKYPKLIFKRTRNKTQSLVNDIIETENRFVINSQAFRFSRNRAYTAKLKRDAKFELAQNRNASRYKQKLKEDLKKLAKEYKELSKKLKKLNIEIKPIDVISIRKLVRKSGLPKEARNILRRNGFSDKDIKKRIASLMLCEEKAIDISKIYQELAESLDKFRRSLI